MSTACFTAATLRYCSFHICPDPYCSHSSHNDEHSDLQQCTKLCRVNQSTLLYFASPNICILCVFPGSPPATGTGSLVIHLEDYNDNAPYVVPSVARVCEDAHDMNVAIVGGRDKDLPPNAAPFKIELGKQPGLDKTWKVTRVNCEYFILKRDLYALQPEIKITVLGRTMEFNNRNCFNYWLTTINTYFVHLFTNNNLNRTHHSSFYQWIRVTFFLFCYCALTVFLFKKSFEPSQNCQKAPWG